MGLLLALLLSGVTVFQSAPAGWSKAAITPDFSVMLPPGAKKDADEDKPSPGTTSSSFTFGGVNFQAEVIRGYEKLEPGATPDTAVSDLVSSFLQGVKKPVVKRQRDVLLNGWPGLDVVISFSAKDGNFATLARAYAVSGSLYLVAVVYSADLGRPASAEPYINSLSIKDSTNSGPLSSPGPVFAELSPKGGLFSVGMPAKASEEEIPSRPGIPKSVGHRFIARYGNRAYISSYVDLSPEIPDPTQGVRNEAMSAIVASAVNGLEAKPVGEATAVRRDGTEYVHVDCATADGISGRVEATMRDRRIYLILMVYPAGHAGAPDIDTFFNSFKLIPLAQKVK